VTESSEAEEARFLPSAEAALTGHDPSSPTIISPDADVQHVCSAYDLGSRQSNSVAHFCWMGLICLGRCGTSVPTAPKRICPDPGCSLGSFVRPATSARGEEEWASAIPALSFSCSDVRKQLYNTLSPAFSFCSVLLSIPQHLAISSHSLQSSSNPSRPILSSKCVSLLPLLWL
jgi:hypothetical protein